MGQIGTNALSQPAQPPTLAAAFVGPAIPDSQEFRTRAFSPASSRFTDSLLAALVRIGHPITLVLAFAPIPAFPRSREIWSRGRKVPLTSGLQAEFLPFLNVTPLKQLFLGAGTFWKLIRWAWRSRKVRDRIIYTYNLSVPPGGFTWLAARVTGSKAVAILCDVDIPGHTVPATIWHYLDFWFQKRLIPRFDGLVSITDAIAEDFAPGKHYLRMEGAVSQEVFDRTAMSDARVLTGPSTFFAAGSLDQANGITIMLRALMLLAGENIRLLVAGRGPLADAVREAAAQDSRIEYLGFIPFEEVVALYGSVDVLLNIRLTKALNTRYVFPSKLMEYLASGTPVISTCPGQVAAEFSNLAFLLQEETPEALAALMKHVATLDPSSRQALGRRARAYMSDHKTWDVQVRRIDTYVRDVVLADSRM